jgi:hypothetical protein
MTALVIDQLEIIARHTSDLEAVVSDPFARAGLPPDALLAIGWLEGCADCADMTVLELLDSLGVSFDDPA